MKRKIREFVSIGVLFFVCAFFADTVMADDTSQQLLEFLKTEATPISALLPQDITVVDTFEQGLGDPVGEAQLIQGTVLVIHKDMKTAYTLKKGLSVYNGDTVITEKKSRVSLLMNDKSSLSLAAQSKMIIDKSFYDSANNTRDTQLQLLFGRVRSVVNKVGSSPNYSIKTPTAVAGVRGTDFALVVAPAPVKTKSTLTRVLSFFNPVSEAHAILPPVLMTAVVTGTGSTVGFSGVVGAVTVVGPASVAAASAGVAASGAAFVGAAAAASALGIIGPSLAMLSVPPEFE